MSPRWLRIGFYLVSTLLFLWPAFLNGYPIFFSDTISYLAAGDSLALALLGHPVERFGLRSEFYSFSIYVLHLRRSLWAPVIAASLLATWTISRLADVLDPRLGFPSKLKLVAGLALLTSLSWRVSMIMPDYLAGLMVIWVYLLTVNTDILSRLERVALFGLVWYAAVSHASHLLLLLLAGILIALFRLTNWRTVMAVLIAAVLSQIVCHKVLYGRVTLFGHSPPFLMARSLADGPGILYAREHPEFTVSKYLQFAVGKTEEGILWEEDGLVPKVQKLNPQDLERIKAEEKRFVVGAALAHPWTQIKASASNFCKQLAYFGLGVEYANHPYIEGMVASVMRGGSELYAPTLQRRNALPTLAFSIIQGLTLLVSLALLLRHGWMNWSQTDPRLRQWTNYVMVGILGNAFITGVISGPFARYHSRVVWLLPLCVFFLFKMRDREGSESESGRKS